MPPRARVRAERRCSSFIRRRQRQLHSDTCSRWSRRAQRMPDTQTGTRLGAEILNLGQDFPPVSTGAWEAVIQKDLKGADYDKKLVWRSDEGLAVRPYYR